MEFAIKVVDKSSLLSDLDLYQIERVIWLRLATVEHRIRSVKLQILICRRVSGSRRVEHRIRSVKLQISRDPNSSNGHYLLDLFTKLDNGHVVTSHSRKKTIGDVVLSSAACTAGKVSRRIKFESTWFYCRSRVFRHKLRHLRNAFLPKTANCES